MSNARGLSNSTGSGKVYVSIGNGVFAKRVKEATEISISRALGEKSPNAGQIVHEEHFDQFTGLLIGVKVVTHEKYGKAWEFMFDVSTPDKKEIIILKADYTSGYASNILMRLPNVNLEKDITLKTYDFKPADSPKNRKGISINQLGQKVAPAYTKDLPNGCPPMEKLTINGADVWDSTKKIEFLLRMVNETIEPVITPIREAIEGTPAAPAPTSPATEGATSENADLEKAFEGETDDDDDDLPF